MLLESQFFAVESITSTSSAMVQSFKESLLPDNPQIPVALDLTVRFLPIMRCLSEIIETGEHGFGFGFSIRDADPIAFTGKPGSSDKKTASIVIPNDAGHTAALQFLHIRVITIFRYSRLGK